MKSLDAKIKNLPKVTIIDKEKIRSKIQEFKNIPIKDYQERSISLEKDYNNIKLHLNEQSKKTRPISHSLNNSLNNESPEYRPIKKKTRNYSPLNHSESSPYSDNSDLKIKLPPIYSNKKNKLPPIYKRKNIDIN
jgi:hypothetical protein